MTQFDFLQPGDIVFTADHTLTGFLIKEREGDFNYSHVCFAGENQSVWTTGASGFPFYRFGSVNADLYLAGKTVLIKRYSGLSDLQRQMILAAGKSLQGKIYNLAGLFWLNILALRGCVVSKLGLKPAGSPRFGVFCSQAVAYCYQFAGIHLTPDAGKEDWTAYTPQAVYFDPNLKTIYVSA